MKTVITYKGQPESGVKPVETGATTNHKIKNPTLDKAKEMLALMLSVR